MFRFTPSNVTTRQSKKANIILQQANEDSDNDDCGGHVDENRHITKNHNHIYYHAEVDRGSVFELIEHIRKAEIENIMLAHNMSCDPIPIYIHINSFGGSVFDALTAIDVIKASKVPVHTIIEGASASAGTLISIVGEKRYIRPNAHMLIHQLSSGYWGKMCELEDDFENNKMLMDKIKKLYVENANIPKKELAEVLKHDLWWGAEKCIKYSLAEELWERT